MTSALPASHPAHYLAPLLSDSGLTFCLSRYCYRPDSLADHRDYLSFPGGPDALPRLAQLLATLPAGHELSIHSQVELSGSMRHIPLIDFAAPGLDEAAWARLHQFVPPAVIDHLAIFTSGRSYHGYSLELLTPEAWLHFMARLLLVNPPTGPQVIDTRWIGHRLLAGYSSLRLSCNTKDYLQLPAKLG